MAMFLDQGPCIAFAFVLVTVLLRLRLVTYEFVRSRPWDTSRDMLETWRNLLETFRDMLEPSRDMLETSTDMHVLETSRDMFNGDPGVTSRDILETSCQ